MNDETGIPVQQTLTIQQAIDLAITHQTAGRLSEAEGIYTQILQINPNQPVATHLLGVIAHQVGKNELAVDLIRKAIAIRPNFAEAHSNLGLALQALGRLDEAIQAFHKAIEIKPNFSEPQYNLGKALRILGRLAEAVTHHRIAIDINPRFTLAHNELGHTLQDLGRLEEAASCYSAVIDIDPNFAEAHSNKGLMLHKLGRLDDAAEAYLKAINIKPKLADAHSHLGNLLLDRGEVDEAIKHYRTAIEIQPQFALVYSNLGNALQSLGRLNEASTSYRNAINIKPDFADAHCNLGNVLHSRGRVDEAITHLRKAIDIQPDLAVAYSNLASVFRDQGEVDEAIKILDLALSHMPEQVGFRIRKTLLLPVIPSSKKDILIRRDRLSRALTAHVKQKIVIHNPVSEVGTTNFMLAYHNRNNKKILSDIAKMYIAICPDLTYQAKHCRLALKKRSKKSVLRIGFLSAFFCNHTNGILFRAIIEHFSRDHFEVLLFRAPGKKDLMSDRIDRTADKVVFLQGDLSNDRRIIENEGLDILFYLDVGIDTYTYYLSFSRLAPVQAVTIGHAETSGVPTIDYFISSEMTEPPDASNHYSEQLIKLSCLPTYYYRPEVPKKTYTRNDYGLQDDVRLYIYPQALFKIHPDFDVTLGKLLRLDPVGRLVLIDPSLDGNWQKLLTERFTRSFPDVVDQVIFVPKMPREKFLGLLSLADALLDNPYLSGTHSGLEIFAMDAPIVAWQGKYCSGRIVAALYRQMGLRELIAADSESYLALVLRLARDGEFKRRMQSEIKANSHKLYERHEVVWEMETFFIAAYNTWRKGNDASETINTRSPE